MWSFILDYIISHAIYFFRSYFLVKVLLSICCCRFSFHCMRKWHPSWSIAVQHILRHNIYSNSTLHEKTIASAKFRWIVFFSPKKNNKKKLERIYRNDWVIIHFLTMKPNQNVTCCTFYHFEKRDAMLHSITRTHCISIIQPYLYRLDDVHDITIEILNA